MLARQQKTIRKGNCAATAIIPSEPSGVDIRRPNNILARSSTQGALMTEMKRGNLFSGGADEPIIWTHGRTP